MENIASTANRTPGPSIDCARIADTSKSALAAAVHTLFKLVWQTRPSESSLLHQEGLSAYRQRTSR